MFYLVCPQSLTQGGEVGDVHKIITFPLSDSLKAVKRILREK